MPYRVSILFLNHVSLGKYIRACTLGAANRNLITNRQSHQVIRNHHVAVIVGQPEQLVGGDLGRDDMRVDPEARARLRKYVGVGSMSAKYAFFAPVFVPMFMAVGISPELTQAAYRVGDSITNVVTPLNPYLVIILVFLRQWVPKGGIGTLMALMVPYALAFTVAWCALLVLWMGLGIPLGPQGPLVYVAP